MKKRMLSLLLALVMVVGLLPMTARAEELDNGLVYEVYEDHVEITDYNGDATEIVIPAHIEGLPVTSIGERAFYYCDYLTSINIPDSVASIGGHAFYYCTSLTSVDLPDSVTFIDDAAFGNCHSLTSINIPDGVTSIGEYVFYYCTSLTDVDLPDSVTSIREAAFSTCRSLTSINIPNGVTSIGGGAFRNCTSLTSIDLPDSVTSIGYGAFEGCTSLTSVTIPDSVTYIGGSAFSGCTSLTGIHVDTNNPNYSSDDRGILFNKEKTQLIQAPGAIAGSYTIPYSVTDITSGAFSGCTSLTSIYFKGDAPNARDGWVFYGVTATAYYPAGNATWTEDVMQGYGGDISWVGYNPGGSFYDVEMGSWYETPIEWAAERGITTGVTEETFNPNGSCLRAQVVTFLHRAAENPEPTSSTNPFSDVTETDFFYKPVLWAVEKNITNGTSTTTFGSYDVCNRAAVVTFLWRAAGSPTPSLREHPFNDIPDGAFYETAVLWALENGITQGISATEFGPTSPCNRAQVVTFLYRAYN